MFFPPLITEIQQSHLTAHILISFLNVSLTLSFVYVTFLHDTAEKY